MSYRLLRYATALAVSLMVFPVLSGNAAHALPRSNNAQRAEAPLAVLYSQPVSAAGGIILSSKRVPDGSAADQYAWDGFRFSASQTITGIRWRGVYDPTSLGSGGKVSAFVVDIYASSAGGLQPDIGRGPLARYEIDGNAGETAAGVVAGTQTYDYEVTLPEPFQAAAQTKYWLQIEACQPGSPDWGLAAGTGGDGVYFRRIPGQGENYQLVSGDITFALLGPGVSNARVYLPLVSANASVVGISDR